MSMLPGYFRLVRFFQLTEEQSVVMQQTRPSTKSTLVGALLRFGELQYDASQDRSMIKISIRKRTAMPRRRQMWTNIIDALENILGGTMTDRED